jgi:hypothetical protein
MSPARPVLAVRRSVAAPARAERVAWCVLALLACVLAHETAYQLMYPSASAYRAAMTLMGHDGYWLGLVLGVAVASVALLAVAATQLRRLRRDAATTPALAADEAPGGRAYLRLVASAWLRLAILAATIYTAQENLEAMAAGLSFRGLDVILGHGLLPLAVILATTLLMSLAVALVRLRRRVLLGRLAAAPRSWPRAATRHPRVGALRPALAGHLRAPWASRAPPRVATAIAL